MGILVTTCIWINGTHGKNIIWSQKWATIACIYLVGRLTHVIGHVPLPLILHIFHIIVNCLSPIVITYVLNQPIGHWLSNDVLNVVITMSLNLKEKTSSHHPISNTLMEDYWNLDMELGSFVLNIKRKYVGQ